ncbi:hypothetical protein V1VFAS_045 [Rhizobium phage V1VFA-S]|jgi:uncharacterized membrane-anchored protein YitT (DUF2179 family)|nr:hypothetical protein B1VFA_068 [Rhizobium phage B1VFA]QNH71760.1 hypothetical protein V1VFAS_045 [Rhizobium phage V1VFA-S]
MLSRTLQVVNGAVALLVVALIIAYASVAVPVLLGVFAGFLLVLWILSHLADGVYLVGRWLQKKFGKDQ